MKRNKKISLMGILLTMTMVFGGFMSISAVAEEEGQSVMLAPEIASLETIEAEPWLQISAEKAGIEGPAFDDEGYLYVCDTAPFAEENHILKIDENKEVEFIWTGAEDPVGIAFDDNGKLYAVCMCGSILVMDSDGGNLEILTPRYEGEILSPNDIVFTSQGNMYITDFRGSISDPIGGVYMLTKDSGFTETIQLVGGLPKPNGISLTPEEDGLWIGMGYMILRINLVGEGQINEIVGTHPVFMNTGLDAADSNKTDSEGNLYQAYQNGGRVLVLNSYGIPVRNIIIPERAEGRLTMTSNLAIKPGTKEGFIMTAGIGDGAWIYRFEALADGK